MEMGEGPQQPPARHAGIAEVERFKSLGRSLSYHLSSLYQVKQESLAKLSVSHPVLVGS